jgi:conjugative transfer signal peptidase TraF
MRVSKPTRSVLTGRATLQRGRRLAAMIGAMVALAAALHAGGIRINLSPSIPVGIYRARGVSHPMGTLPRGTLVSACLPLQTAAWGEARGYLMRGSCADGTAPVGKPIFASAGDTVTVGPRGLARNGELVPSTAPLTRDRHGRPLPEIPWGVYRPQPGQLWLVSTHAPDSWDSRYYGPVSATSVVAVLHPLWVAR